MDGLQIIELMGFRLPRSRIRISTEFSGVDTIQVFVDLLPEDGSIPSSSFPI